MKGWSNKWSICALIFWVNLPRPQPRSPQMVVKCRRPLQNTLNSDLGIITIIDDNIFWVVVSNRFYVQPDLGKIAILTNIFQRGCNHQLVFQNTAQADLFQLPGKRQLLSHFVVGVKNCALRTPWSFITFLEQHCRDHLVSLFLSHGVLFKLFTRRMGGDLWRS